MRFVTRSEVRPWFEGKRVAVVGSGPGCARNPDGMVDGHDVVVRVNNYCLTGGTGRRTDVFYSFFGTSIRKPVEELQHDGVKLCMCKCPDAHAIESEWHRRNDKMIGVDFRPHYRRRADWWFCDTYVPTVEEFMVGFKMLGRHMPTSGFACIIDILSCDPRETFLTGFDFFRSGIHNVNEPWQAKNTDDPFRHEPERERAWLIENLDRYPIALDATIQRDLAFGAAA